MPQRPAPSRTSSSPVSFVPPPSSSWSPRTPLPLPHLDSLSLSLPHSNADVGQFTILDPATVTEADLGANFFLDPTSLGKPRAQEVVRFLLELNSDVKGHSLVQVRLSPGPCLLLSHSNLVRTANSPMLC